MKPSKATASQQSSPKWWQRPSVTDWILAVTTLAYVGVNIFMLLAIHRQANIAQMNTDVMINAERAWFDIDVNSVGPSRAAILVTNYGKTFGILSELVIVYGHLTQQEWDELPDKLETGDEEWGTRQTVINGGLVPPGRPPFEITQIDPRSFIGKQRDLEMFDVFVFRFNYSTLAQECWTEIVYLAHETHLPDKPIRLVPAPHLTHYE